MNSGVTVNMVRVTRADVERGTSPSSGSPLGVSRPRLNGLVATFRQPGRLRLRVAVTA